MPVWPSWTGHLFRRGMSEQSVTSSLSQGKHDNDSRTLASTLEETTQPSVQERLVGRTRCIVRSPHEAIHRVSGVFKLREFRSSLCLQWIIVPEGGQRWQAEDPCSLSTVEGIQQVSRSTQYSQRGSDSAVRCGRTLRINQIVNTNRPRSGAGTHVYNPHLFDNLSTSCSVRKAGAQVPSPPCLGEGPHGWVPVDTHSTPVPSSIGQAVGGLCSPRAQWTTETRATRTISLQMISQLTQFFALSFLSISSVSTEQWQLYVKNLRAIKIDRGNLRFWWVNQLFSTKSRQKFLCRMKTLHTIKFFGSNTFKKLNRFHQKAKWVNSVRKQDSCVLLKLDNISWPRTLVILDNFAQWLVENILYLEVIQFLNRKDGYKEIWELDLYWKSRPVFKTSSIVWISRSWKICFKSR